MASLVRPTLILTSNLDERLIQEETEAELRRSLSYVAPAKLESHPAPDAEETPAENTFRLDIRLGKPYWSPSDPQAQELWNSMMERWLANLIRKVNAALAGINKTRTNTGLEPFEYAWIEFQFAGNALVRMAATDESGIPANALEIIEEARNTAADGPLSFEGASVTLA